MKTTLRMYILSLFAFAMATFLLIHFAFIWAYGKFYIYESNKVLLTVETAAMLGGLAFSGYCGLEQLIRLKSGSTKREKH